MNCFQGRAPWRKVGHEAISLSCTPKQTVKQSMTQRWFLQIEFEHLASCIHNKKPAHLPSPILPTKLLNSGPPEVSLIQA